MYRLALLFVALAATAQVHQYGRMEIPFQSAYEYSDPLHHVALEVEFDGPNNNRDVIRGFWDGGKSWKVRYAPELKGTYKWRSRSHDSGLNGKSGQFTVTEYKGDNLLYREGIPRLSYDRHYLVLSNAKPWLYLADTAWNGPLLSTAGEWKQYLDDRAAKRFTAVQFVMTQWRAGRQDERGDVAFTGHNPVRINPRFFQRMDEKVKAINDAGLVGVAVALWALSSKDNESPGTSLDVGDASGLAEYMVARYAGDKMIWFLGGDGDYTAANADKWKQIGSKVFPDGRKRQLVGMHPRGMASPWRAFQNEGWLDLFIYQSGHSGSPGKWKWNATEGPALDWMANPVHPVIDAEINYEGHVNYEGKKIDDFDVRRAAYYSLLSSAPAGIGYGAHGVWSWTRKPEVPMDHPKSGLAEPWNVALRYPGSSQMKVLHDVLDSIEWWRLRPDRALIYEDQFKPDYSDYILPAMALEADLAVVYLPKNPVVKLQLSKFDVGTVVGTWVDPRTGARSPAGKWPPKDYKELRTPGQGDWLLILKRQ